MRRTGATLPWRTGFTPKIRLTRKPTTHLLRPSFLTTATCCCELSTGHTLVFSSPEQLAHFIEVMATKPLPTSRALSARLGTGAGPNDHWLSRLPADLKPPAARSQLVRHLKAVYAMAVTGTPPRQGKPSAPPLWPGLNAKSPSAA